MSTPPIISTTDALADFCTKAAQHPFVAIDTEFLRERTYRAELCLVQVAAGELEAIIDPLGGNIDLSPLYELLANEKVLKVLHASRQDLEIFHDHMGKVPAPVFDTQIAAMALGLGENISYDQFIRRMLGHGIDKASRYTDWSKRPLSAKQLNYAMADATCLRDAFVKLQEKLEKSGRSAWIAEDMAALAVPALYQTEPTEAWRRIKAGQRSAKVYAVLRELAAWREREASRLNVPRGRVIKDEALVELAASQPKSAEDLSRIRGLERAGSNANRGALLDAIATALASDPTDWPTPPARPAFDERIEGLVAMLQMLLKLSAEAQHITPSLICAKAELESLARGERDLPILKGWRNDVFGSQAMALMEGKLALRYDPASGQPVLSEI